MGPHHGRVCGMRWTIGMASYNNFDEVYFTIQSLRLHHDLTDCEIVIVDNFGCEALLDFCEEFGAGIVRYEKFTEIRGTAAPRNRIFEIAHGDNVVVMDSHTLLKRGFFDNIPSDDGLYHGPCQLNSFDGFFMGWNPAWRRNMWGAWKASVKTLPEDKVEIWGSGLGVFACRREAWLGFNKDFRGFGGEEGYIHEKYRRAGRKVWCDPSKVWVHYFCNNGRKIPFEIPRIERVRNYLIGFEELGMDTKEMEEHFGPKMIAEARGLIAKERATEAAPTNDADERAIIETERIEPQEVR